MLSPEEGIGVAHGLAYQVFGVQFNVSITPCVNAYQELPVDIFRLLI